MNYAKLINMKTTRNLESYLHMACLDLSDTISDPKKAERAKKICEMLINHGIELSSFNFRGWTAWNITDNKEIKECYDQAMKDKLYDWVKVHGPQGPMAKAYACNNCMEYFAELSAAFLGQPDMRSEEEFNKWLGEQKTLTQVINN